MAGSLFEPGDDVSRVWDEAEAILLAAQDLDAVMEVIREAESPVEARRALKLGFGFTGRQAALLLTLPVMSFTRSERQRFDDSRRVRMELLADVTGVFPAIPAGEPGIPAQPTATTDDADLPGYTYQAAYTEPAHHEPAHHAEPADYAQPADWSEYADDTKYADSADDWTSNFGAAFDGVLADISSAMAEPTASAPPLIAAPPAPAPVPASGPAAESQSESEPEPAAEAPHAAATSRPVRRSMTAREETSAVLDDQIGELCDAIAALVGTSPPGEVWSDDPRSSSDVSGAQLDRCGVNDETGIRTLMWHLRRTGLDSVEGLFPFAEPLTAAQGFDAQSLRFESARAAGALGSQPSADVRWSSGLWPIAERSGFGYAVSFSGGSGAVWAYGGDEPLHRLWDSVVDLLVELYQSLMTGTACDAAVAAPVDGRVVWTNLN